MYISRLITCKMFLICNHFPLIGTSLLKLKEPTKWSAASYTCTFMPSAPSMTTLSQTGVWGMSSPTFSKIYLSNICRHCKPMLTDTFLFSYVAIALPISLSFWNYIYPNRRSHSGCRTRKSSSHIPGLVIVWFVVVFIGTSK